MKTSTNGINLIKKFEGCVLTGYKDPGSASGRPYTIGYGSTTIYGRNVVLGEKITEKDAETQLIKDLSYIESAVIAHVKVPLTQGQFDAIISWVYNCGVSSMRSSTWLKRINQKDYKGAIEAMTWWVKGSDGKPLQGLVNRRNAEKVLYNM